MGGLGVHEEAGQGLRKSGAGRRGAGGGGDFERGADVSRGGAEDEKEGPNALQRHGQGGAPEGWGG